MKERIASFLLSASMAVSLLHAPNTEKKYPTNESLSPETTLLLKINDYRVSNGLNPVVEFYGLDQIEEDKTRDMADKNYFDHVSPTGDTIREGLNRNGIRYIYYGEIIGRNEKVLETESIDEVFNKFLQSPGHNAVILDNVYDAAGIGYTKRSDGMNYFGVVFIQMKKQHSTTRAI